MSTGNCTTSQLQPYVHCQIACLPISYIDLLCQLDSKLTADADALSVCCLHYRRFVQFHAELLFSHLATQELNNPYQHRLNNERIRSSHSQLFNLVYRRRGQLMRCVALLRRLTATNEARVRRQGQGQGQGQARGGRRRAEWLSAGQTVSEETAC